MKNGEVCLRISYDKEQSKTLVPLTPNLLVTTKFTIFVAWIKWHYAETVARGMISSPCLICEDQIVKQ